ncbi:MAG: nitric-oxide reductase large subunit [Dokdonella sp.]|nr:nitric-oxide reductase large subunit [Dokdonella sp.]
MSTTRRLWIALGLLLGTTFAVLLWMGSEIHRLAPPLPERVVAASGQVLFTRAELEEGRQVWQSFGGQQLGSVWGHGALVAPDWSADWLHRESSELLDLWARRDYAAAYANLGEPEKASLKARLQAEMRSNTYDADAQTITVSNDRALAISNVAAHYVSLFSNDPATQTLREGYAMRNDTVPDLRHRQELAGFFFWTSWAAATNRPDSTISYTSNWPYEPLVGNSPTPGSFIWTVFSVLFMIAGIGLLAWHYAVWHSKEPHLAPPAKDPLAGITVTPSMRATAKYFWVVLALVLVQILLGAITAHYQVEGQQFYGFEISQILPYSLTRSWHTELAVLWIATAWLATGLYIAPAVSGHEPKFQRLGVNILWVCLLIIVVGAFAGQWFAVMQKLGLANNFWFGHQGWEYVDLGRFWQIFLFVGLLLWLGLVGRALWPALRRKDEMSSIVGLLFLSTIAIALFYGAGLMWSEHTHISMVEYWRWWVVHLWVEGFFEVFAVAVISFLFVKLGLVRGKTATVNVLFATIVFMAGGVLGTFHHLYWSGTPISVLALGAVFSALEVVPLAVVGFEAYNRSKLEGQQAWEHAYRWPFRFFAAVLIWNLVGAGLLGFLINPPIALYYMQGLNTTATHGHAALFGVYGMLGLGLILYCMRGLTNPHVWNEKLLSISFWSLNIGLFMMTFLSLLPQGLWQTYVSFNDHYAAARSAELMHHPMMEALVWARVPGDIVFAFGVGAFALFFVQAFLGKRRGAAA